MSAVRPDPLAGWRAARAARSVTTVTSDVLGTGNAENPQKSAIVTSVTTVTSENRQGGNLAAFHVTDPGAAAAAPDGYPARLAARRRRAIEDGRWCWTAPHMLAEMAAAGCDPGPPLAALAEPDPELAAERAVIQAARAAEARGEYPLVPEAEHLAFIAASRLSALQRPPAWTDTAFRPPEGAWCSCCSRHTPGSGGRWWRERIEPKGWRCWPCHPPVHLAAGEFVEVRT